MKAADYGVVSQTVSAFVSTNSVCQGQQVPILWPLIFVNGQQIQFAYRSFKWANLASYNAGVTVVIVGIGGNASLKRNLFSEIESDNFQKNEVANINPYLVPGSDVFVSKSTSPINGMSEMLRGNMPYDGGNLLLSEIELDELNLTSQQEEKIIRRIYGSAEFIKGLTRFCIWVTEDNLKEAIDCLLYTS